MLIETDAWVECDSGTEGTKSGKPWRKTKPWPHTQCSDACCGEKLLQISEHISTSWSAKTSLKVGQEWYGSYTESLVCPLAQGPRSDLKMEGLSCVRSEKNRGQGLAPGKILETMPFGTSENAFSLELVANLPLKKKSLEEALHQELKIMRFCWLKTHGFFSKTLKHTTSTSSNSSFLIWESVSPCLWKVEGGALTPASPMAAWSLL